MDPAVMTMVNVTLFFVLAGYFLTREHDLPARRPHRRRHRARHWRRAAHPARSRRGPGAADHP